jgi:hypothetical protein
VNLETAKTNAERISRQGEYLSIQTFTSILCSINDDIKRLKNVNLLILKMRRNKSLSAIFKKLRLRSLKKATLLLNKRLNSKFHRKIISKKIVKLSKKKLIRKSFLKFF